jgi:predicted nucleic acid-binding protein
VDASVVIKWLLPEEDQPLALRIRNSYQEGALAAIAPRLIAAEIGNVMWKYVTRGLLTGPEAERAFFRFHKDAPLLRDSPVFDATALRLAVQYKRTFYDSLYLALALHHNCDLVTADKKFVAAMQSQFSSVHLLRDYGPASA